ncbi:hypothetical protein NPIL_565861 [Nephila pilipes]|uniref:Uncharacterized protein n=1 Tax=Nephila pilipes TaxID=299642 RepID=A0A8X6U403_NEPPI|nr:hypothetical protein NPIL_565861 [Nephila pilipes]
MDKELIMITQAYWLGNREISRVKRDSSLENWNCSKEAETWKINTSTFSVRAPSKTKGFEFQSKKYHPFSSENYSTPSLRGSEYLFVHELRRKCSVGTVRI